MFFLFVGIVGIVLKFLQIDPVAGLEWWMVLSPLGLAVIWWAWADASGYTKRKAVEKMEQRAKDRLKKQREALGMTKRR